MQSTVNTVLLVAARLILRRNVAPALAGGQVQRLRHQSLVMSPLASALWHVVLGHVARDPTSEAAAAFFKHFL